MFIHTVLNKKGYFENSEKYERGRLNGIFELSKIFTENNKGYKILKIFNHTGVLHVNIEEKIKQRTIIRVINRQRSFMILSNIQTGFIIHVNQKEKTVSIHTSGFKYLTKLNDWISKTKRVENVLEQEREWLIKNGYKRYAEDFTKYKFIN